MILVVRCSNAGAEYGTSSTQQRFPAYGHTPQVIREQVGGEPSRQKRAHITEQPSNFSTDKDSYKSQQSTLHVRAAHGHPAHEALGFLAQSDARCTAKGRLSVVGSNRASQTLPCIQPQALPSSPAPRLRLKVKDSTCLLPIASFRS